MTDDNEELNNKLNYNFDSNKEVLSIKEIKKMLKEEGIIKNISKLSKQMIYILYKIIYFDNNILIR